MGARGPKPAITLKIVEPRPAERLKAPQGMTAAAKKLWQAITESLPVSHFGEGDAPLLRAYCEADALHRQAVVELEKLGAVIVDRNGMSRRNPWMHILTASSNTLAMLSVKLKINANSRGQTPLKNGPDPGRSKRAGLMFGEK